MHLEMYKQKRHVAVNMVELVKIILRVPNKSLWDAII